MKLPLTDAQVERAAREYCRLIGADPDAHVALPGDGSCTAQYYGPQWTAYSMSVQRAAAMQAALEFMQRPAE